MLYTAIDIHKSVFQAAALDTGSGEISDALFPSCGRGARHRRFARVDAAALRGGAKAGSSGSLSRERRPALVPTTLLSDGDEAE